MHAVKLLPSDSHTHSQYDVANHAKSLLAHHIDGDVDDDRVIKLLSFPLLIA